MLALENSKNLIPIHVVTGFLGSGKTTLLNQLLQQMQRTIVIVNEFGEISVDHLLIETTTEDMMILEGGCVCCTVRTDLLNTLEDLFHNKLKLVEFEQVIIETTGLADPVPILRTLIDDSFVATHYCLDTVVTTVDAVHAIQQLEEYDESVKQIALAHHLILTKIDLIDNLTILTRRLKQLNPTAKLHTVNLNKNQLNASDLFDNSHYDEQTQQLDINRWLQTEAYTNQEYNHKTYLKTFCIEYHKPLHWLTLEHWIQQLTRLRGKDLLRVKGIAYTYETDLPVIIQGVQHIFQAPSTLKAWPDDKRITQIVFITRNIEKQLVERVLQAIIDSKNPVDICNAALLLL